jgi:hypothetical protein
LGRFTHTAISCSREQRLSAEQAILELEMQIQRMHIKMFPLITTAKWLALWPPVS